MRLNLRTGLLAATGVVALSGLGAVAVVSPSDAPVETESLGYPAAAATSAVPSDLLDGSLSVLDTAAPEVSTTHARSVTSTGSTHHTASRSTAKATTEPSQQATSTTSTTYRHSRDDGKATSDRSTTPDRSTTSQRETTSTQDSTPAGSPPAQTTTGTPTTGASGIQTSGRITFYAAADNDPPGSRAIAYPKSSGAPTLHNQAGGTGTYDDPLTFAAAEGQFAPGTRIYVPLVQRYFILEDSCASCGAGHIDLWAGPATDQGVIACEEKLTPSGKQPYEINPPPGRTVTPGDLYRNGSCG